MKERREIPVDYSGFKRFFVVSCMNIFLLASGDAFCAAASNEIDKLAIIDRYVFNSILILLGILIISSIIVIYFAIKLRRVNRKLNEKNRQILDINHILEKTNTDLENQKRIIDNEHYESEKFYGMLFQSADDGISFYDRDLKLKYSNSAFYTIIGHTRESFSKIDPRSIIHPDDRDYYEKRNLSLLKEGFFESDFRVRHTDGHYVSLSTRSVAVRNDSGEIMGSLTISRDISRLKKDQEDLLKAKTEAETSSRLKSSFLANISHEIRTPLNSVVGFANLLLSEDINREVREEYVEQINHNSEKLLQIIGDIIDLSRLESSQIEITYEETSLVAVVNETIRDARQMIRRSEKSITLNVRNMLDDNSDLVFTDRLWLKRILNHLMDNAVKFTLDGSIDLMYWLENDFVIFSIKDTGIGINKENLSRIFEEFSQEIDGHHRPFEGLGIGLTLAKEVVERMGGRIFVKSEKGMGSEFSFSIPYRQAGSARKRIQAIRSEESRIRVNWSSKKCLLVDDNKDILLYLNRILSDTGIEVITARSGKDALELIRNTPDINVVLLDMQMPEMNGTDVAREIRKISKNLPIIAQTAFIFEDDKDIIIAAGCDSCLIKPIRKENLIPVMSSFIDQE